LHIRLREGGREGGVVGKTRNDKKDGKEGRWEGGRRRRRRERELALQRAGREGGTYQYR